MQAQRRGSIRENALKRDVEIQVEVPCRATAEAVYEVLAEIRSHLTWAGERQKKNARLLTVDAPEGPALVGTEFTTTGADPIGRFTDRSVVTEATPSSVFEFVTEARLVTKRGKVADWTNVHRYELTPSTGGCSITYSLHISRISALPGPLALFNVSPLSGLLRKATRAAARRGVESLATVAEERAGL